MSHSPATAESAPGDKYRKGWEALFTMLHGGGSLSGRERSCCFLNTGQLPFANISAVAGFDHADDGRALGIVDWDHDGALDVWTMNRTAPRVRFLKNRSPNSNSFVALRLEGKTCNRDAIGARIEITTDVHSEPLIRSLRAGEGYLSQSSKWVHVGLGNADKINRLSVRWPGGVSETFAGAEPRRWYRLVEGTGEATRWQRKIMGNALESAPPMATAEPVAASEQARVVLAGRMPIPKLTFESLRDESRQALPANRAFLVNLWASWCGPCLEELSAISKSKLDLEVIAVSVDREPDKREAAREALNRIGWNREAGFATDELVEALDGIQQSLLNHKKQFPIPTSFLIDDQGRIAAIYKGVVDLAQLQQDLVHLDDDEDAIFDYAVPFSGFWNVKPNVTGHSLLAIASGFTKRRQPQLAQAYLSMLRKAVDPSAIPEQSEGREAIAGAQINIAAQLYSDGRRDAAVAELEQALRYAPESTRALYNLGLIYESERDLARAEEHYRAAITSDAEHAESHFNLGHLLFASGQRAEAIEHYRSATRARPEMVQAHYNLGHALLSTGQGALAEAAFREAVRLDPQNATAHYQLGNSLLTQRKFAASAASYERSVELDPNAKDTWTNLAGAYLAQQRIDDAIEALSRVVELDPNSSAAHRNLGQALKRAGRETESQKSLQRAQQLE